MMAFLTEHGTRFDNCEGLPWQCVPVELTQVKDKYFTLVTEFKYRIEDDAEPVQTIDATPGKLGETDLASIPFFLRWFAVGYGRHTPVGLLHDQLRRCSEEPRVTRERGDRIFLIAMQDLGVPAIRRGIMSAAVVLDGRMRLKHLEDEPESGLRFLRFALTWIWLFALIASWVYLCQNRTLENLAMVWLLVPIGLALVWETEYYRGLIAGWWLPVIAPFGAAGTLATFGIYWLPEKMGSLLLKVHNRKRDGNWSPVPGPTPWGIGIRIGDWIKGLLSKI